MNGTGGCHQKILMLKRPTFGNSHRTRSIGSAATTPFSWSSVTKEVQRHQPKLCTLLLLLSLDRSLPPLYSETWQLCSHRVTRRTTPSVISLSWFSKPWSRSSCQKRCKTTSTLTSSTSMKLLMCSKIWTSSLNYCRQVLKTKSCSSSTVVL